MPNGTFFQAAAPSPSSISSPAPYTTTTQHKSPSLKGTTSPSENGQEAATKLAEAIDDFLGDLEKKFKGISDEILTKLDDMAERCDRLEQEMLVRESSNSALEAGGQKGAGSQAGSG
jgi:BMFP domain-containing protein YqiC